MVQETTRVLGTVCQESKAQIKIKYVHVILYHIIFKYVIYIFATLCNVKNSSQMKEIKFL